METNRRAASARPSSQAAAVAVAAAVHVGAAAAAAATAAEHVADAVRVVAATSDDPSPKTMPHRVPGFEKLLHARIYIIPGEN